MPEREKRQALNEALFREMNERVEERVQSVTAGVTTIQIVCECGRLDCTERITLTTTEYEQAHASGDQFTVIPGHAADDVEEIVSGNDRFEIVRKRGVASDIANDLDTS